MLDIGGTMSDPTDESLVLRMIDYPTLNAISGFTKKNSFEHLTAKQEDENIGFGHDGGIDDDDDTMEQEIDDNQILANSYKMAGQEGVVSMTGRSAAVEQGQQCQ